MAYWRVETLEREPEGEELTPVTRYAKTDDVLVWFRAMQDAEAPRLIAYRLHKSITQEEYEQGVG